VLVLREDIFSNFGHGCTADIRRLILLISVTYIASQWIEHLQWYCSLSSNNMVCELLSTFVG